MRQLVAKSHPYISCLSHYQVKTPEILDNIYAAGGYRTNHFYFSVSFLTFDSEIYNAVWLRTDLQEWELSDSHRKLMARNKRFVVKIDKYRIHPQADALFRKYQATTEFNLGSGVSEQFNLEINNAFVKCLHVYDGSKLIGYGLFEEGKESLAGLNSIYDPDYSKYSIGRFMILQKYIYAKEKGLRYFYPGYYVPGHAKLDYKLGLSPLGRYYFHPLHRSWLPHTTYDTYYDEYSFMYSQLQNMQNSLMQHDLVGAIMPYHFYDFGLYHLGSINYLLDIPMALFFANREVTDGIPICKVIVFHTRLLSYQLMTLEEVGWADEYKGDASLKGPIYQVVSTTIIPDSINLESLAQMVME